LLDSNADANVYTTPPNGGNFQKWTFYTNDNRIYFLQDVATGLFLDGRGAPGFGNVYTTPYNGGAFQQWEFLSWGNLLYSLRQVESGLVLDSNADGNVYTNVPNGGPFQIWFFWSLFTAAAVTEEELRSLSLPNAPPVPESVA
jgi:hypothetical protein